MCNKCRQKQLDLEIALTNLVIAITQHNSVMSSEFKVKLVLALQDNQFNDLVIMSTVEKSEVEVMKNTLFNIFTPEDKLGLIGDLCPKQT